MVAKIIEVFPAVERQYQDREGRTQTFKSKGFIFMTADASFYAEAVQEWASHWETQKVKKGICVDVHPTWRYREYKDANGVARYSNECTITNMVVL